MRRFSNSLFALAAFLWLPVSVHCQLESISGFEFLRCAPDAQSPCDPAKDCDEDGCCAVEKSHYQTGQFRLRVPTPDLLPLTLALHLTPADTRPAEVSLGLLTTAPPPLLKTWQFASRTALPPRAPSIAS